MSLKTFHIVFISISTVFAFGYAAWFIQSYMGNSNILQLFGALLSTLGGIGMIMYGTKFLKKFRHVKFL